MSTIDVFQVNNGKINDSKDSKDSTGGLSMLSIFDQDPGEFPDIKGVLDLKNLTFPVKVFLTRKLLLWQYYENPRHNGGLSSRDCVIIVHGLNEEFAEVASHFVAAWIVLHWDWCPKSRSTIRKVEMEFHKHYHNMPNVCWLFKATRQALMKGQFPAFFRIFLEFSLDFAYNEQKSVMEIFSEEGGILSIQEEYDYAVSRSYFK